MVYRLIFLLIKNVCIASAVLLLLNVSEEQPSLRLEDELNAAFGRCLLLELVYLNVKDIIDVLYFEDLSDTELLFFICRAIYQYEGALFSAEKGLQALIYNDHLEELFAHHIYLSLLFHCVGIHHKDVVTIELDEEIRKLSLRGGVRKYIGN